MLYYAGVRLPTPDGVIVGTPCVADREPGRLTDDRPFTLETLAQQVVTTQTNCARPSGRTGHRDGESRPRRNDRIESRFRTGPSRC